ncbi:ribosomal RNA small subunit methyltransferase G isoform X1 [Triticum urartu]|uniref:ribosomal RNA small subunit methyltransferase G isoform X1 n=1 Tax=Triticum urartu TaxID=4572 RepID=UPI002044C20D|nr:ribosomal RNA small subunit methyltransferase G isoform X1 [Triticum urartu]
MSLCCCSAGSRRLLLSRLLLGQGRQARRPLLHLRTTATAAASSSATSLSTQQQRQVSLYVEALLDWNQRMNLTAVTDESEVMTRHVVDSLAVLPPLERAYTSRGGDISGISLVDVGSGAGLPGLILAVARPSWKFTLLESMRKRCTFLEHAVEVMELSNVDVVCDRAEGFHSTRTTQRSERRIEVANGVEAEVAAVGDISLELADGFKLQLKDVLYVPSCHRNLISVSCLDKDNYECYFGHGNCVMWFNNAYVGDALLHDELYLLSLRGKVHSVCNGNEHVASNKEQKKRKRTHDSSKL